MDRVQFAARIDQLLASKNLARRLGERGRQLLRDKFGFHQYISGLEEMFSRLVNQHSDQATATMVHGQTLA
jgi:hypothetical protein